MGRAIVSRWNTKGCFLLLLMMSFPRQGKVIGQHNSKNLWSFNNCHLFLQRQAIHGEIVLFKFLRPTAGVVGEEAHRLIM